MGSTNIVKVTAEFDIGGDKLAVSSFSIRQTVNSIPEVTLRVAPGRPTSTGVNYVDVDTVLKVINKLSAKLGQYVCNMSVDTEKAYASEGFGSLELRNWRLTSVGLGEATAAGSLSVSVTISHPAYALLAAISPLAISTQMISRPPNLGEKSADPLALFFECLAAWADKAMLAAASGGTGTAAAEAVAAIQKIAAAPQGLIESSGAGMPLPDLKGDRGMWHLVTGALAREGNLWELLINAVQRNFYCCIKPDFTKDPNGPLILKPYSPWEDGQTGVNSYTVASLQLPSIDFSPIAGVIMPGEVGASMSASWIPGADGGDDDTVRKPDKVFQTAAPTGRIMHLQVPGWVMSAMNDTAFDEGWGGDAASQQASETAMEAAFMALAKSQVQIAFRQDMHVTVGMPVVFPGGPAVLPYSPGDRIRLVGETKSNWISFFVSGMEQRVDCSAGHAMATLIGSHVRFGEGDSIYQSVIGSTGTTLALYGAGKDGAKK